MRILITGSNGLLGQKLIHKLSEKGEHDFLASSRGKNRINALNFNYKELDITSQDEIDILFEDYNPNVVINTAAMTNVDQCEDEQEACTDLNVNAVRYLAHACARYNTHMVHLSTDFIFDGESGPYKEGDTPNPLSFYGDSKLKAEKILEESGISFTILRTILVYGVAEEMSRSNIVLWAKGALAKEQDLNVVDDQFRAPTLAEDLADACISAAEKRVQGVYHISGPDQMSVLELVQRVAKFWNFDASFIHPISSNTLNQRAHRPPVSGFIIDKARKELDYNPHHFEEGLKTVDEQLK